MVNMRLQQSMRDPPQEYLMARLRELGIAA